MAISGKKPASTQRDSSKRALVVYFSRTGYTKSLAQQIRELVNGELFEIETLEPYPKNFDEMLAVASKEKKSDYKPPLKSKVESIDKYDVIFIGFPIWDM